MYSDGDASLNRRAVSTESNARAFMATQGNFKITQGVIEGLVGMESPEHIGMVYSVRLLETDHIIRCRRLVNSASFDGIGEYNPLEEGDPVVVAFKGGLLQDGIILGSFYTEGTYNEFYVRGQGALPRTYKTNPSYPIEFNQPSVHPNRIAQPDAWFHIMGGKFGPYRDPALTDGSIPMRATKRPPPASIELKNKLGDVAQWAKGDIILYSDSNIILFSSQDGKSKCKRLKEMADYYQQMVEELEAFIGLSTDTIVPPSVLNTPSSEVKSILNGESTVNPSSSPNILSQAFQYLSKTVDSLKSNAGASNGGGGADRTFDTPSSNSTDTNEASGNNRTEAIDDVSRDDIRRSKRYPQGTASVDYMMYAPMVEYHLPQLRAMAAKCKELSINCKEEATLHSNDTDAKIDASKLLSDPCTALSNNPSLDDSQIETMAQGTICQKGEIKYYPFNKWKLQPSQATTLGDATPLEELKDALIHKATLEAFNKMRQAALQETGGAIDLGINSAYRDKEYYQQHGLLINSCEELGGQKPQTPNETTPNPTPSDKTVTQTITGLASWYGPGLDGNLTANGETFNQEDLTAAHLDLPFNTQVKVTNIDNNATVTVRINDRGPYAGGRIIDLSYGAAKVIGMADTGEAMVKLEVLQ